MPHGLRTRGRAQRYSRDSCSREGLEAKMLGGSAHDPNQPSKRTRDTICGLSPLVFWILILVMAIIVASAIGGGVGGGLASQHSNPSSAVKLSSSTTAASSTATTANLTKGSSTSSSATAVRTSQFYSGCQAVNGDTNTPMNAEASNSTYQINGTVLSYKIFCNTNFADYRANINPGVRDMQILYNIPTLNDCITECSSYTYALATVEAPPWQLLCSGVGYASAEGSSSDMVSCYLKSGLTNSATNLILPGTIGEVDSAVLQWSGVS